MTAGALRVLADRLTEFGRHQLSDPAAHAVDIAPTSGHAGLSYTFRFVSGGMSTPYFLRLPPAGVRLEGTADVLRQVCALNALNATAVPHAGVVWSGDDTRWFGVPYFITEWLDGVTLDLTERVAALSDEELQTAGRQAVEGLVGLRAVPWQQSCGYLAPVADLEAAITRWDRFYERAADRDVLLHLGPGGAEDFAQAAAGERRTSGCATATISSAILYSRETGGYARSSTGSCAASAQPCAISAGWWPFTIGWPGGQPCGPWHTA